MGPHSQPIVSAIKDPSRVVVQRRLPYSITAIGLIYLLTVPRLLGFPKSTTVPP
jgi:hypothetical protein